MSTTVAAFVSYSREDSDFALRLAQDLKAAGAAIWLDQVDIHPGVPWDNAIEDALRDAPQILVVLTPTSVRSENVRNEISFALRKGKIIIPVLYQDCDVPLRLERTQHSTSAPTTPVASNSSSPTQRPQPQSGRPPASRRSRRPAPSRLASPRSPG